MIDQPERSAMAIKTIREITRLIKAGRIEEAGAVARFAKALLYPEKST